MKRLRIVVIDDQPRLFYPEDWDTSKADFLIVKDPLALLEQVRDLHEVDCFFIDHKMPGTTGDKVSFFLRGIGVKAPVLKIGAFNEPGYPEDCIFIGKMLSIRRVRKIVDFIEKGQIYTEEFLEFTRE